MTLRAADLRFVLPHAVETAAVVPSGPHEGLSAIARGLEVAGVRIIDLGPAVRQQRPDLVVATAHDAVQALRVPARTHLLLGRASPRGTGPDRAARSLLIRGPVSRPMIVVPTSPPTALRHYLGEVSTPPGRVGRARNRVLRGMSYAPVPLERLLPATALVSVQADRGAAPLVPEMVRAARDLGIPSGAPWLLSLGNGDDLQRAVFYLYDGDQPRWVLKFSRIPGVDQAFVRDQAGLALVRSTGGAAAAHAPDHVGRFEVSGRAASVETAAPGRPLLHLLTRRPLPLLERIAEWVLCLGRESAAPSSTLAPERLRLEQEVLPQWRFAGVPADLMRRVPAVPAVLQHNDLGSWNIVTDGQSFMAVDWESARPSGMPLWDIVYFLADALARLDGPADVEELLTRTLRLFAGESPHSPLLFGWIRRAAGELQVPTDAVGPLVTLCWLHHGLSSDSRTDLLKGAEPAARGHLALLGQRWLADPALGPAWPAWARP